MSLIDSFGLIELKWIQTPLARKINNERERLSSQLFVFDISFLDILDSFILLSHYQWGYSFRLLRQSHHAAERIDMLLFAVFVRSLLFLRFDFLLFYFDRQSKMSRCIWMYVLVVIGNLFIPFDPSRYRRTHTHTHTSACVLCYRSQFKF